MSDERIAALEAENESLRQQLAKARRRANRALARHQQHALSMETIRQKNEELDHLTAELRKLVEQLSTPILQVWPRVLALPIVGVLDEERVATITEHTLTELSRTGARHVILDLTGASTVDERTVRHVIAFARTTRLLGAHCVLCGIQPGVATAMVGLEADLGNLVAVRNLYEALSLTGEQ